MKVICSSETSLHFHGIIRRYISEDNAFPKKDAIKWIYDRRRVPELSRRAAGHKEHSHFASMRSQQWYLHWIIPDNM
jgi:hypothetical protein